MCCVLIRRSLILYSQLPTNIILPVILGKFLQVYVHWFAYWLSVPTALKLEEQDRAAGIIKKGEYLEEEIMERSLSTKRK